MKILIVDDSKAMRMMVAKNLREAGFSAHTFIEAGNGKEALQAIQDASPDVVLSDWNMPEMNGYQLLEEIGRAKIDVKFGFVTTESTDEMREKARLAGALFLIAKPFTSEAFQKHLEGIIK